MRRSKSDWMSIMIGAWVVSALIFGSMINSESAAAGPEKVTEIKIGVIESLTGSAAGPAGSIRESVDMACSEINAAGGIKSLGGAKLKLIWADYGESPDRAAAVTERLITEEKISAMMGGHVGPWVLSSTAVAEKYKTPYVVLSCGDGILNSRGFKYVFQPMPSVPRSYSEPCFTLMEDVKKSHPESQHVKTVATLSLNMDTARQTQDLILSYSEKYGYKCVLKELFPSNVTDFNPTVLKLKSANPDMIHFYGVGADGMLFLRSLVAAKLAPKMIFMPASGNDPRFHETMKQYCNNVMVPTPFCMGIDPQSLAVQDRFKKRYGKIMNLYSGGSYPTLFILQDALERAGSIDPAKVRDALAKTDLQGWPQSFLSWKKVKFDETGWNINFGAGIMQLFWEQGKINYSKVVWPQDLATFQYSWPGNWGWLK